MIIGMDPAAESTVSTISQRIVEGSFFRSAKPNSIVIGKTLATTLGVHLNSKIVLSFVGTDGTITYAAFRIIGIFDSYFTAFDKTTVFVRQTDLLPLLGSPMIHEIAIRLASSDSVEALATGLKAHYPGLSVQTWQDLAPQLKLAVDTSRPKVQVILGIIVLALVFGITNTMLMSVMERTREFGVLMAIGMNRLRLFLLVVLEAVMLSFTGGIVGVGLGLSAVTIAGHHGLDLSRVGQGLSSFGFPAMAYPTVPLSIYVSLTIMIFGAAVLAAMYPAWKAIRFRPAAAIRTYQ